MSDAVNRPSHYNAHPHMECIELVEMLPFCEGNAIKYLWRAGLKGPAREDLEKALWYVNRAASRAKHPFYARPSAFQQTLRRACEGFESDIVREAIRAIGNEQYVAARSYIQALIKNEEARAA